MTSKLLLVTNTHIKTYDLISHNQLSAVPFYPMFSSPETINSFPIYFLDLFGIILNRKYLILYKDETFYSSAVDLESRILDILYW